MYRGTAWAARNALSRASEGRVLGSSQAGTMIVSTLASLARSCSTPMLKPVIVRMGPIFACYQQPITRRAEFEQVVAEHDARHEEVKRADASKATMATVCIADQSDGVSLAGANRKFILSTEEF
jgi:hypothetical protein